MPESGLPASARRSSRDWRAESILSSRVPQHWPALGWWWLRGNLPSRYIGAVIRPSGEVVGAREYLLRDERKNGRGAQLLHWLSRSQALLMSPQKAAAASATTVQPIFHILVLAGGV